MKYLLWLFLVAPAAAQSNVQIVHEVAASTSSITQTIDVTTQTAVDVALETSSGTLTGAFAIEVYNLAASAATIVCGFDPSLSTTSSSAWYGREVPAGVGVYWAKLSNRKLYCQSLSTTAATRATITQFK